MSKPDPTKINSVRHATYDDSDICMVRNVIYPLS